MAHTKRITVRALLVAIAATLVACAGSAEPDAATVELDVPKCRSGETYSCVERMGRPVRCFCADKDTLRELLEPTTQ